MMLMDQGRVLLHTSQLEGVWYVVSTKWCPRMFAVTSCNDTKYSMYMMLSMHRLNTLYVMLSMHRLTGKSDCVWFNILRNE